MSKLIIFSFEVGTVQNGFPAVIAQFWEGERHPMKFVGRLPAAPELAETYRTWQSLYIALCQCFSTASRIKVNPTGVTNISEVEFGTVCQRLAMQINRWLGTEAFRSIEMQLRTHLHPSDEIRVLIETHDPLLQRLPWQLWNFFDTYPKAEIGISAPTYQRPQTNDRASDKVKILAIFGDSEGIDLTRDRELLAQLSDQAEIEFLVEPSRSQLHDRLWQQWDMLFFAGHSSSQAQGWLRINAAETLTLEQLRYGLQNAIAQGLKLAIFNSCDGIALAQQLADLHIPQVIVMREPVPDPVAHAFLKRFLIAFSDGNSLYEAVREGRERLQGLENRYPCASWLPVIYQNPAITPIAWQDWCKPNSKSKNLKSKLPRLVLSSVGITALVVAARWFGLLQAWELQTFDQFMRLRPHETEDQRLLMITVTEEDLRLPEQQQRKGSLSDLALVKLLEKLKPYQPRAIGLDIYRDFSVNPDQANLAAQLRANKNFFAVCKTRDAALNNPGVAPPPEVPLDRQGFSDAVKDSDGVIRRALFAIEPGSNSPCTAPYALSAQLAFRYLEQEGLSASYNAAGNLQIGDAVFKQLRSRTGGYQTIDDQGYQFLLNYRSLANPEDIAPTITLRDVLTDQIKPDQIQALRDRIILIGVTAQSAHDYHLTPYSTNHDEIPGVIVQAHLLSQILSAVKEHRREIQVWSIWGEIAWISLWAGIGGVLAWRSPRRFLIWMMGSAIVGLYVICLVLFIQGYWVPIVSSAIAFILTSSTVVIYRFEVRLR